jgi:plastocyanin
MKLLSVITGTVALLMTACQPLPSFSRSGEVTDIVITDRLSAVTVQMNAGDEIRWTNMHRTPVRITISDYVLDKLSCRSNFSGHFYSGAEALLQPNESAGLCFLVPGTIRYIVRMESAWPSREVSESGLIEIGASPGGPTARIEPATVTETQ